MMKHPILLAKNIGWQETSAEQKKDREAKKLRYKTILAAKVEEERKEALQQEKLKEKNGITEKEVVVKKRTGKQFSKAVLIGLLNLIRFALAMVGVLVLIDPTLREAFLQEVLNFIA